MTRTVQRARLAAAKLAEHDHAGAAFLAGALAEFLRGDGFGRIAVELDGLLAAGGDWGSFWARHYADLEPELAVVDLLEAGPDTLAWARAYVDELLRQGRHDYDRPAVELMLAEVAALGDHPDMWRVHEIEARLLGDRFPQLRR